MAHTVLFRPPGEGPFRLAVIAHGNSSRRAITNAIRLAAEFSRQSLAQKIQSSIADLHSREAQAVQG